MSNEQNATRKIVFISKATPGDDAFALWLAPRLEAEGYEVFADILKLRPGDGWRLKITKTLQDEAVKMLLCCSDTTLNREGVIEEIEIAKDLSKSLSDPNFIIPLKMERYKKLFGIGGLQYIDFERGWAEGLTQLLAFLEEEDIPKLHTPNVKLNWANYQRRKSVSLQARPEILTSNWLRVMSAPDRVNFVAPVGSVGKQTKEAIANNSDFPVVPFGDGYLTFAGSFDFEQSFPRTGSFEIVGSVGFLDFRDVGWPEQGVEPSEAKKALMNLFRQAWELHLGRQRFTKTGFANGLAFIVGDERAQISQRISWGRQGKRRNSMLRNVARKKVWEYGVSAQPSFFPFPHFRLKARVLFSEANGKEKAAAIEDAKVQHRLRRSICSTWRNKAWHGRLMAFMELLAGESPYVSLPVGMGQFIVLDAMPIQATSPVSARQRNKLGEDGEENDLSTIDGFFPEDDA
ncbi:toll/interleukin-1 receptor domain-containing protein [Phaeobacter sp. JH18-32]|uniref:toll/interleukin-1 receptor domain-containing protein n=1 Tax=Phaeobacter TaxID=302485 RepID=UPI003A837F25